MRRSSMECLRSYAPLLPMISITVYFACFYFDLSDYGVTRNLNELVEGPNRSVIDHLHLTYFKSLMGGDSFFHCMCLVTVGTFLRSIFIHLMKSIEDFIDSKMNPSTGNYGSIIVLCTLDTIFAISYFDMAMGYSGIVFSSFGRLQHIPRWNAYITLAPLMIWVLLCVHTDGLNENTSFTSSNLSTFNNSYTLFANKKSRNTFFYMFTTSLLSFVGTILAAQSTYVRSKELCVLLGSTSAIIMATLVAFVYKYSASMFTLEEIIKDEADHPSPVCVPNTLTETVLENHNNRSRMNNNDNDNGDNNNNSSNSNNDNIGGTESHSISKTALQRSSSSGQLSNSSHSSSTTSLHRDMNLNLNESNLSGINGQSVAAKKGSRTWKSTRQTPTSKKSYYLAYLYMVIVISLFCVHIMSNMELVNIQTEAFLFMFVDIVGMAVMSNILLRDGSITMSNMQYIELIKSSKKVVQDRTSQFLRFISHEMATPLSSLAMFMEFIREQNKNSKDRKTACLEEKKDKIDTEVMHLAQESIDDLSEVLKELSHFCRMDGEIASLEDADMVLQYYNPSSDVLDASRTKWIKKIEMLTSSLKKVGVSNKALEKSTVVAMSPSAYSAATTESSNHSLLAQKNLVNEETSIFDLRKIIRLILVDKSKSDKVSVENSKDVSQSLAKQMVCQVVDLKGVSKSVTLVNETSLSTKTSFDIKSETALPVRVVAKQGVIREVLSLLLSEALSACKAGCKAVFSAEMRADMLSTSTTAASSDSDATSSTSTPTSPRGGTHTYPVMDTGSTSPRKYSRRDIGFLSKYSTSTSSLTSSVGNSNNGKMDSSKKEKMENGASVAVGRNAASDWDTEIDNFRFVRFRVLFPSDTPLSQQEIDRIFDPWKNLIPGGSMKNSSAVRGMILSFAMMRRLLKQSQCTAHLNIECDDDGYTEYILEIEVGCLSDKDLKTYLESTSTNKSLSSSSKNTISEKKKKSSSSPLPPAKDVEGGLDSNGTAPRAQSAVEQVTNSNGNMMANILEEDESNLFYCDLDSATATSSNEFSDFVKRAEKEERRSTRSGSMGRSKSWSSFLYGFNSQPSSTSLDRDFGINVQQVSTSLNSSKKSDSDHVDSDAITTTCNSVANTAANSKEYTEDISNSADSIAMMNRSRCLVVEDEDANRHLCAKLTTAFGYDTMQASDGIECLRMILGEENVSKSDLIRASQNSALGTIMHGNGMSNINLKSINDLIRLSSISSSNTRIDSGNSDETKEFERKEGERFDLVVIDNMMPNLSGIESVRMLRSAKYNGTIIGLTAHTDESVLEAFKAAGCDKVFVKPLKVDEFRQFLSSKRLVVGTTKANNEFKNSM